MIINKKDQKTYECLQKILVDYRLPNETDSFKMYNEAIVITYRGRGKGKTFQNYQVTRVDFARVARRVMLCCYADKIKKMLVPTRANISAQRVYIHK